MKINIISTDNKYLASDYTITNLVDGEDIFFNTPQEINIINKSKAPNYVGYKKEDTRLYGIRLFDDVPYWFNLFYKNEAISFFVVSSYESYLLLKKELHCEKPVLYLEDVVMTPSISDNIIKTNRIYTFFNPSNLDDR
jgi:hypothetical protein